MPGFTKLHADMLRSSIWNEDDKTRIVWITLLLLTDRDGFVGASMPGLAHAARVDLPSCEAAIERLSSPDKYSRTKNNDGRRIEEADGGWLILNYAKHRNRVSDDPKASATRERVRRFRAKQESERYVTPCNGVKRNTASASADMSSSGSGEGGSGGVPRAMPEDGWSWEQVQARASHSTVGVSEAVARGYFDRRTACGWVDAAGRAVAQTLSGLDADLRSWSVKQPSHGKQYDADQALRDDWRAARRAVADAIWTAKEQGEDVSHAIRVCRDKWGDTPSLDGRDAVTSGVDVALNNTRRELR